MSVRKRVWKTRKGIHREAWVVDYVDQAGKRCIQTFDRKKDADAQHATVRVEVADGTHTARSKSPTVREAGEAWHAACARNGLERSTLEQYRNHLNGHIYPYLANLKLSDLSAPMVREFQDKLRDGKPAPGAATGVERSAVMVRKITGSLSALLSDAHASGSVNRNVVRELRSRRKRNSDKRQNGKIKVGVHIPSPPEIRALVTALTGRWRPLILTAIFTGLRASELRGLRWKDIKFDKKELSVEQRADAFNAIGKPKSESGERTVPMPPLVVNTLREWKLQCPKGKLDLVFPNGKGNVESLGNILKRGLIPAVIKARVTAPGQAGVAKYSGLHALRHFYASWCINRRQDGGLELPLKVVQTRLGHATITMTADVYGHLFPRSDDGAELAAAERLLLG